MTVREAPQDLSQPGRQAGLRSFLGLLALLLCAGTAAPAHDFWIEAGDFTPAAGQRVALGLWSGDHLSGLPVPRSGERMARFAVLDADGQSLDVAGVEGVHPAGFFVPPSPGPYWVVFETRPRRLVLEAPRFERYLLEEGLEAIVEERRRRSESSQAGRESYRRCAKSLIEAGGPAASLGAGAAGCPLELLLETAPSRAAASRQVVVRLLLRGRPLAGARVAALRRAAPGSALSARTDEAGRVELPLAGEDLWLIKAVHMERAPAAREETDWESWWASLTFRLPAAGPPPPG